MGPTMRGETMADELVGETRVVVHRPSQPAAEEEWVELCVGVVANRAQIRGLIVLAHGADADALGVPSGGERTSDSPPP